MLEGAVRIHGCFLRGRRKLVMCWLGELGLRFGKRRAGEV